jgi:cell division transport system permease protein
VTARWILRRVQREARRRAVSLAALAAAVALLAVVAGAGLLGVRTTGAVVPLLEHNVHVIAYLGDELGAAERTRLLAALEKVPGVERARLVEPDEALVRLKAAADSLGGSQAVAGVEPGFLPRSVEISVAGGAGMATRTGELAARLRKLPGVVEVDAMSAGLSRLMSWMSLARRFGLAALSVAAFAGLVAVALALSSARGGRRRDVEVLSLLGESPSGIRREASITGAGAALVGALAGVVALLAVFPRVLRGIEAAVGLGPLASTPSLGGREVAVALVLALVLGWLGGYLGTPSAEKTG